MGPDKEAVDYWEEKGYQYEVLMIEEEHLLFVNTWGAHTVSDAL